MSFSIGCGSGLDVIKFQHSSKFWPLYAFLTTPHQMKALVRFNSLIKDLKALSITSNTNRKNTLSRFNTFISQLSQFKANSTKVRDKAIQVKRVSSVINSLKALRSKVYNDRLDETKNFITQNPEMFKISSFELMQHNFRENTHSNILKYLLDYNFNNNDGIEALYQLLNRTKSSKIKRLKDKLFSKKYKIEREFHIDKGRIDLLITDDDNKLIIIIENKIYASIAEKDFDREKNVTSTQLDLYKDYFESKEKYKNWDKAFILLSYRDLEGFEDDSFELISYGELFKVLSAINYQDTIAKDYLILLYGLTKNIYDKNWLIEQSNQIKSESENLNLNVLEIINNFTNGN